MSNTISPSYEAWTYGVSAKSRQTGRAGAYGSSFLEMALAAGVQAGQSRNTERLGSMSGIAGMGNIAEMSNTAEMSNIAEMSNTAKMSNIAEMSNTAKMSNITEMSNTAKMSNITEMSSAANITAASTEAVESPSLESMLKARYPNLVYHVFDASSSYWKTRNDYPHYLLYQSGDEAKETLENWKPAGENPFYGSIGGQFIAPKEIHALGNVPPGSKAVVIHPKVQERMEADSEYAKEIMERIDTWFAYDVARNEAIRPGCTAGMSQAVAIGEDGNICNAVSSSCGGEITRSSDEMVKAYYLRMAKRADFMHWLELEQMEDSIQESVMQASALAEASAAKARLAEMMNSGRLQEIFGDKIAGVPTETVLAITQAQVWGGGFGSL